MAAKKAVHASNDSSRLSALSNPALLRRPSSSHTKQDKRTHAGKSLISVIALLAMLSITCTFGGLLPGASGSTELNGPIIAMVPGSSVDKNGGAVDAKFTFDPSTPQMAVVVQVGKLSSPSPMTITWYQVTDQGDQKLFTDTVQVSPFDRAYSIGKNPGTLAEGNYKIVATINEQTQQIEVSVAQPSRSQAAPTSTAQTGGGQPPVSGGGGSVPRSKYQPAPSGNQASSSTIQPMSPDELNPGQNGARLNGCKLLLTSIDGNRDSGSDQVEMDLTLFGCDAAEVQVSAAVDGSPQPWTIYKLPAEVPAGAGTYPIPGDKIFQLSPCSLPGSNDLPAHHVMVSATVLTGSKAAGLSTQVDISLGDDTSAPLVGVVSTPARGKVKAGDRIKLDITVDEPQPGGPWQTGVKDIQVLSIPGNLVGSKDYGPAPHACTAKNRHVTWTVNYTVPENPPAKFDLCVIAEDYVLKASKCGTFYTVDHWQGTIDGTGEENDPSAGEQQGIVYHATLDFTVNEFGYISGQGVTKFSKAVGETCIIGIMTDPELPFGVGGTATADHLALSVGGSASNTNCGPYLFTIANTMVIVPITGPGIAEGNFEISGRAPYVRGTYTIRLTCQGCQAGGK
jgi:hypothetical protein